ASHRGQKRKSGEPYITHPLAVTMILAQLGAGTTTLVASLPLAVWAAIVYQRLRRLGVSAPGPGIALVAGVLSAVRSCRPNRLCRTVASPASVRTADLPRSTGPVPWIRTL
ncbi:hypothetical protein, partial [Streptomyces sp. BE303]|uniref:hypothetical protein n=1 Tax=Streptomyces sp. BE303 TaxID=3002528 RepID=UPI002E767929